MYLELKYPTVELIAALINYFHFMDGPFIENYLSCFQGVENVQYLLQTWTRWLES